MTVHDLAKEVVAARRAMALKNSPLQTPVPEVRQSKKWQRWVPFDPANERHVIEDKFKGKRVVDHPEYGKLFLEFLTTKADEVFTDRVTRGVVPWGEPPPASLKAPQTAADVLGDEMIAERADTIKPKAVKWVWNYRIPMGKFSVLAGNPDQGKSLVSVYMAAQISRGLPLYGDQHALLPASEVLILAAEDDAADTIIPRLQAAGAALPKVHILKSIVITQANTKTKVEREAQLDKDVELIEAYLKRCPGIRLVIIDPVSSFLGSANMNREQEVRAVLTPLKSLAERRNIAIVAVMHTNKMADQDAIHRVGGAVAFTGVARAVWMFMEDETDADKHLMLRVKNNIAKKTGGLVFHIRTKAVDVDGTPVSQPIISWVGDTDASANILMSNKNANGRPEKEKKTATEWLRGFLTNPQTATDVESFGKKAGHAWGTIRRSKDELGVVSAKYEDKKWYWELPPKPVEDPSNPTETVSLD